VLVFRPSWCDLLYISYKKSLSIDTCLYKKNGVPDRFVANRLPKAPNIKNIGDDYYEQEIPHFDIYNPKNWENLDNKSKDILLKRGYTREMNLNFSDDKYHRHFSQVNFQ